MSVTPQWKKQLDDIMLLLGRQAWIPKLAECDPMYEGSKYFGVPWMPKKGGRWPTFEKKKMTFMMQLDLSQLPSEMANQLGLKDGFLQFFRSEDGYSDQHKDSKVRIVKPNEEEGGYKLPQSGKSKPQPLTPEEMAKFKSYTFKELRVETHSLNPET